MINYTYKITKENKTNYLKIAKNFTPHIYSQIIVPSKIVTLNKNNNCFQNVEVLPSNQNINNVVFNNGDSIIIDFENEYVGYLSFSIKNGDSRLFDSPLKISLLFAEVPSEIYYEGNSNSDLSSTWIQQEDIIIDSLPCTIKLKRRYAFRFLKISMLGINTNHSFSIKNISLKAITSANKSNLVNVNYKNDIIKKIDYVGINTLLNCMHKVFEDGPKRDRRLWIGDLRLQALTNYYTFNNYDLVKRCLYLFAGKLRNNKCVASCLFVNKNIIPDDWYLGEYSLYFGDILLSYYLMTQDKQTLNDLYNVAYTQFEFANYMIKINKFDVFIDWQPKLDKTISALGIAIYTYYSILKLAQLTNNTKDQKNISDEIEKLKHKLLSFYNEKQNLFISNNQISYHSQIFAILSNAINEKEGAKILESLEKANNVVNINSPYMFHNYIEALIQCKMYKKAKEELIKYWGDMANKGYGTYFEVYDKNNDFASASNDFRLNSYCHAWSCSASYFIRKYPNIFNV